MLKLVRGVTFFWLLALGVTSFLVLLTPSIVLMLVPLSPVVSLRRWYGDLLVGLFLDYSAVGLLMLGGTKVSLYTNEKEIFNDRGTLLLCNHRTRVDWMYAGWVYNMMCRNNKTLRFIMKDELRAVPVFGWVMQIVMCIFLNRKNKERDLMELTQKAKYLQSSGARPSVFLFPEGTDLSPESVAKAHVFAKERQLPLLDYVLYPKVAGMCALLHAMKGNGGAVHDITIAYEDHVKGQRTNEKSIFSGQYPKHIHLCVRRFELDDLPSDKHMAERWLKGSFLKKERLLKSFYESDHVVPQDRSSGNKDVEVWPPKVHTPDPSMLSFFIVLGWDVCLVLGMAYVPEMRWLLFALIVVCTAVKSLFRGFDVLELGMHGGSSERGSRDGGRGFSADEAKDKKH